MRIVALLTIVAFGIGAIVVMAYTGISIEFALAVAGIPTAAAIAFFSNFPPHDKDKNVG